MDSARWYDEYWLRRDPLRSRARSRRRAELALDLLRADAVLVSSGAPIERPTLLEVGCGPGWALEVFAAAGFDAQGTDVSEVALGEARARGLAVAEASLDSPVAGPPRDVIVALEVLEHLAAPLEALDNLARALAPGGRLVVSLPNEFHVIARLSILAGRPPFGGHEDPHLRHFDGRSALRLFAAAGLEVIDFRSDGLVPPRHRRLAKVGAWLASISPGLFALSNVYLLVPGTIREASR